ncbi:FAD-binding oxidoreductase [Bradyrhizobium sp. 156]|nr:FAD-binding oxidoreductase [Bradyrhizobium sp. 156]
MSRRSLLQSAAAVALLSERRAVAMPNSGWVRPGDQDWPSADAWRRLAGRIAGTLQPASMPDLSGPAGARLGANPFFIGEEPALTQSSGWIDAWQSAPSSYVLRAETAQDVRAAIAFARRFRVRLVVRGGGHSYVGGSNSAGSLLVWTRSMNDVVLHDTFVPAGTSQAPVPAVSVGAGCTWGHVYEAVVTRGGRYVQGGGCTTVGVAGLVQGGGFGSFSKAYGLAAASLLEAEIVTADARIRTVNAARDPNLFWALKGGGGGSFGVITRLTLRTHDLPDRFGAALGVVKASSPEAFRELLAHFLRQYRDWLLNPHWGEQVTATPDNRLVIRMVFQGFDDDDARAAWDGFTAFIASDPKRFKWEEPLQVLSMPARRFWDPEYLERTLPGIVARDDRSGAPRDNWWWRNDGEQAGAMWHGYESLWLSADLLAEGQLIQLADAWLKGSREWPIALHFNKGLAGADAGTIAASHDTSMNPSVLGAFALAIVAGNGPSSFPGLDREPDRRQARSNASAIGLAYEKLLRVAPGGGSYVSECGYHLAAWEQACWGEHWGRLLRIKDRYDSDKLFLVHHGVGSTSSV